MHELFLRSTKSHATSVEVELPDAESQKSDVGIILTAKKVEVLSKWFGPSAAQIRQDELSVSVLCTHLENLSRPWFQNPTASIWQIFDEKAPEDCWSLFHRFLEALDKIERDQIEKEKIEKDDLYMSHVCQKINSGRVGTQSHRGNHISDAQAVCIYTILCWMTMTLQPNTEPPKNDSSDWTFMEGQHTIKKVYLHRPIAALFQRIYNILPSDRWKCPIGAPVADQTKTLHVASLNYKCLSAIGKIRIEWVDNIGNHLDFNAEQRKLSLFRFPTFCALSTSGTTPKLINSVQRSLFNHVGNDSRTIVRVHQEVLLSYRLLFGKSGRSLRLISKELDKLKEKGQIDLLLETLCLKSRKQVNKIVPSTSWPVTCLGLDDKLLEDSTYSAFDDFPFFGQRLLKLQEFIDRQSASGWKDLWRDTRNPLQWYTFWAVLVVGGTSIAFTVLQFIVGCLQLWIAIQQLNAGNNP